MSWVPYLTLRKQASLHWSVSKTVMWIVLFYVSCTSLLVKGFGNDEILGKGRWLVLSNLQCDDPDQYVIQLNISRRKMNRTHDAFSVRIDLDREINDTYGAELNADKEVDGGYKFYQKLTDDSFCNMLRKYAGDNFPQILAKAKVDPPDCPIPAGEIVIEDFVVDYRELEETGMYGKFDAVVYITYLGQPVACSRWLVQFEKQREDYEDDDDDDDYYY